MHLIVAYFSGALAQLARAPRLHRGGQGFESPKLHHVAASCLSLAATFFVKSPPAQPGGVELKRSIEKRRNRRSGERREKGKQKEESEKKATMEMRRIEAMQRPSLLENPKG